MSIEQLIAENTAAIKALTAALANKQTGTAAPAGATTTAKPAAAKPAAGKTSAPAATVAKAEKAAAQEKPAVDLKALGTLVTHIADDFLDGENNIGRPRIVALLQEFGAKKLNLVPADRLHEFAGKAQALFNELSGAAGTGEEAAQESLV